MPKLLVAGATGVTGTVLVQHFAALPDWQVVATSRRPPWLNVPGVEHVRADLTYAAGCAAIFGSRSDITHIIYAAVNEDEADIVRGWDDPAQAEKNVRMLRNLLEPFLAQAAGSFRHITLIHGMKAYGSHLPEIRTHLPFKENDTTYEQLNFYHHQQAYVTERAAGGSGWDWTVLRPNGTIGTAIGGNMNWSLALGVFAALCAEAGEALPMPPGESALTEITDADIVAKACAWAATTPQARRQVYNLTNGDILTMHDVFPILADAFGLTLGSPRAYRISEELTRLSPLWPGMVRRHGLRSPEELGALLGATPQIVDIWSAELPVERKLLSGLSSTIKIRHAGFADCADSAATVAKYIERYRQLRILPPAR
ncbi:NAD-dependent epimerase/dehydratase family protein [Sphingomonas jatrophae]|uniref:Nucleoside-diphosphate-sugar epimerase n=1 Tax=Sphingomonas jatrophae TaxID=1166337 RepID=A0A1I6K8J0_9SPHN|nr:NAD-dependent epimerase/dehydratase family protein [Sphingomonas jatrophae]SFR87583.1 Nucleoside-diphosphate-sugar epimerase [Sphingomonas jatrophae]